MKLPVQLLVSGGVTMAAPSVNTLAGGHEARSLSATGGAGPFGGEGMAQMHRLRTADQSASSHARWVTA